MKLSIVVIFHNMRREAQRTLRSLSCAHQQGVARGDFEVIAIDNGSDAPLDPDVASSMGENVCYEYFDTASPSPVDAVAHGVARARGTHIAVIVDGARMATPGLVGWTLRGLAQAPDPFVCALSWQLGPGVQTETMQQGYDQAEEDRLLDAIAWPRDGYRLFEISALAQSSGTGWFGGVPAECSWFAMRKDRYLAIGGFDPRFQSPGGGFVNHHFRDRARDCGTLEPVMLLGEGVFHQFHGGVATNALPKDRPQPGFHAEYERIMGARYTVSPWSGASLLGHMPDPARRFLGVGAAAD